MFLFVLLFGLSMDYHVFILSRVSELWDGGASTTRPSSRASRAPRASSPRRHGDGRGVRDLRLLSLIDLKQMGVGLAAAVLIDATIIRGVLLPASMKLLGKWNWWMPRSLSGCPSSARARAPEVPATR